MDLYYKIMALTNDAPKSKKDYSCTIGVGDGSGELYVHGDYESIKHLQDKLLELENFRKHTRELSGLLETYKNT